MFPSISAPAPLDWRYTRGSGFRAVTLNYIVQSSERVDEVLAQAKRARGGIAKPARSAQWGGYFGYFRDPDGYLWKVVSG